LDLRKVKTSYHGARRLMERCIIYLMSVYFSSQKTLFLNLARKLKEVLRILSKLMHTIFIVESRE